MLSVIIPTLNAASSLPACLQSLMPGVMRGLVGEVIIADGGSSDPVSQMADHAGAVFLNAPPGRGSQLAAGAAAAKGEWLLFLHADTRLQEGWAEEVASFLASASYNDAAYFTFRFDDMAFAARIVEVGVAWRCRLFKLPYGDQALLISRQFYEELGGFCEIPLFEDVEMVRAIARCGKLQRLQTIAITSAERHQRDGYPKRVLKNFRCLMAYFRGVPPEQIVERYR
ncbi:MAG: TIGR04283 family arsenosugar biosynthesis glycosyltransferase [bacterium]